MKQDEITKHVEALVEQVPEVHRRITSAASLARLAEHNLKVAQEGNAQVQGEAADRLLVLERRSIWFQRFAVLVLILEVADLVTEFLWVTEFL